MAGRYREATKGLLRATVLDSVADILSTEPLESVSMAQVASAAGVSRQSLYNEFGSRDELISAYVLSEAESFLTAIEAAVTDNRDDMGKAIHAAVEVFLDIAAEHPLLSSIATGETGDEFISRFVAGREGTVLTFASERLSALVLQTWPAAPERDAHIVCELVVRVALSHLTQPTSPFGLSPSELLDPLEPYLANLSRQFG